LKKAIGKEVEAAHVSVAELYFWNRLYSCMPLEHKVIYICSLKKVDDR
jgi:hypothetical protein